MSSHFHSFELKIFVIIPNFNDLEEQMKKSWNLQKILKAFKTTKLIYNFIDILFYPSTFCIALIFSINLKKSNYMIKLYSFKLSTRVLRKTSTIFNQMQEQIQIHSF